jgi:uncharacterized protein YdeI (YjbR/CyaY-like superfamily)
MPKSEVYLRITTRREWRAWLEANHSKEKEAWLTIRKSRSPIPGLRLSEAVEEALCFGWIDGAMHSLDTDTFALRFSPRRPGAVWSAANQRRAKQLIAEGRMTEAGLDQIRRAKRNGEWRAAALREDTSRLPEDLSRTLAGHSDAGKVFSGWTPSRKKMLIWWVESAKRPETRSKRIREIIRQASEESRLAGHRSGRRKKDREENL